MYRPIVYLAGVIWESKERAQSFYEAQRLLDAGECYRALNPITLPLSMPRKDSLRIRLAMVEAADMVFVIPGDEKRQDHIPELKYARFLGIPWGQMQVKKAKNPRSDERAERRN